MFENWTDQEIITQLNNAAQDEAEQKFQVDQNNPTVISGSSTVELQIGS